MKRWIIFILLVLIPPIVQSYTFTNRREMVFEIKEAPCLKEVDVVKVTKLDSISQGYYDKLAYLESRGNYKVINRYGYMGKYQFHKRTLRYLQKKGSLTISNYEIEHFIEFPEAQERAVRALTKGNYRILQGYGLHKYIGTHVKGVEITMEGMLASAHLLGAYAVKQFIFSNGDIIKKDGNGTTIINYMKHFS